MLIHVVVPLVCTVADWDRIGRPGSRVSTGPIPAAGDGASALAGPAIAAVAEATALGEGTTVTTVADATGEAIDVAGVAAGVGTEAVATGVEFAGPIGATVAAVVGTAVGSLGSGAPVIAVTDGGTVARTVGAEAGA